MLERQFRSSTAFPIAPEAQFYSFVNVLFERDDLVEIRVIEHCDGQPSRRLVDRSWSKASELSNQYYRLLQRNFAGANIYFGVNPRSERAGTKDAVPCCRVVWADLDNLEYADASRRWRPILPSPSIVLHSGHGVHLYWLLDEPFDVRNSERRALFEAALRLLYRDLGADCTQDVTRLLRLPGFNNTKADPVACRLFTFHPEWTYPIETFSTWFDEALQFLDERRTPERERRTNPPGDATLQCSGFDVARIRGILRTLDEPSQDRSRRDFWCVTCLLRLRLTPDEIAPLVTGRSKFTTQAYLQQTLQNAVRAVGAE